MKKKALYLPAPFSHFSFHFGIVFFCPSAEPNGFISTPQFYDIVFSCYFQSGFSFFFAYFPIFFSLFSFSIRLQLSFLVDDVYTENSHIAGKFAMLSSSRVYVGGSVNPRALLGVRMHNNFVGCLRKVSFPLLFSLLAVTLYVTLFI